MALEFVMGSAVAASTKSYVDHIAPHQLLADCGGLARRLRQAELTDKAISPLRQRLIDDLAIRRLGPKTQHEYIRRVKGFADFLGRFPAKATAEDVHRYQLRLASIGATVSTVNATASALRFFFKVTLKRSDLADEVVSARELYFNTEGGPHL